MMCQDSNGGFKYTKKVKFNYIYIYIYIYYNNDV